MRKKGCERSKKSAHRCGKASSWERQAQAPATTVRLVRIAWTWWREPMLGAEALDRFVAGEPLWRVHEAVAAVLALESDPVDPRL